jgi:hypothetical protein
VDERSYTTNILATHVGTCNIFYEQRENVVDKFYGWHSLINIRVSWAKC